MTGRKCVAPKGHICEDVFWFDVLGFLLTEEKAYAESTLTKKL